MDQQGQNGLMRTFREGWRTRAASGWLIGVVLTAFYCALYFTEWFEAPAKALGLSNKWFLYGMIYNLWMIGGAVYYLKRHGNSRYNRIRISVNVGVQVLLAFCLPFVMHLFGKKDFYVSYIWPLKIEYLYPSDISQFPIYIIAYSLFASLVAMPILTILFGKRWYCSWICGCGGLANTFGDPFRHLSDKSVKAWRFEKVTIHAVMVIAVIATLLVSADFLWGEGSPTLHLVAGKVKYWYGFIVGMILSGIVGVAVYPVLGPRIWCRNFCPMAAMMGLIQKAGRYRIRVKKDMCISCGNCSTYCEMGIDVRSYAQKNESFTRASCVGCGVCAHVCPRGVLKLENQPLAQKKAQRKAQKRALPVIA